MNITEEEYNLFIKMEEELERYNDEYRKGRNPKEPKYDIDLFRKFRDWQQERIANA